MDRRTSSTRPTPSPRDPTAWLRRIARVLLPAVSLSVTLQPAAFAAPTPSLLSQAPMFLDISVQSNVMFLMDDSSSMNDIRLPVPAGLDPQEAAAGNVTTAGGVVVERVNEWLFRSAALNPLYYNPAITYRPWNENGRAGASGAFTASTTNFTSYSSGFREGLTPQDNRYVGPNYRLGAGNFGRLSTATGANPPAVAASANRPPSGGFAGASWDHDGNAATPARQQDLFSSPFVFVTSLTQTCSGGLIAQSSSPSPFTPRIDTAQPSTPRTDSAQPSSTRLNTTQASTPRTITPQPASARPSAAQPSTPRTDTARPFIARVDSAQPSTARSDSAQPATTRVSTAPTSTARPTEYRIEQVPLCDGSSFSAWSTTAPAPNFCVSGEGVTRPAAVQTRLQPCPGGATASGSVCLSCAAGSALSGAQCISDCPSGSVGTSATQCFNACPAGTTQVSLGTCRTSCPASPGGTATQCFSACPAGTSQTALGTCTTTCPGGTTSTATQCLQACPGGSSPLTATSGTCRTNCPGGTTATATACFSACPGGSTSSPLGTCLADCPGGLGNATTCFAACPVGTQQTALGTCASTCPGGTIATATACFSPCAAGTTQVGGTPGTCRSDCPASPGGTATLCYSSCPAGTTQVALGTCRTSCPASPGGTATLCFSACPAGSSQTTLGSCRTDCAAGAPSSATQCFGVCPAGTSQSGGSCLSCPAGYANFGASPVQCCPLGSLTTGNCPAGQTCSTVNRWYLDPNQLALARYYVFQPVDLTRAPTPAELSSPANYLRIEINRERPLASYPTPFVNNDPTQGRAPRSDCAGTTFCTFAEEAQNFANWYTYYRTRLFSAIAVTAEAMSRLDASNGLDRLRLGYGSINYFPQGADPYAASSTTRLPSSLSVDSEDSVGAVVRGVRPFAEGTTARQEVFDWLFSLRGLGSTPNREALDAVGRYFARTDNRGPWIEPTGTDWFQDPVVNAEPHISCRRNFAILVTDGEWTRVVETSPPQQPLMELSSRAALPAAISAQGGSPLASVGVTGPSVPHAGIGIAGGRTYQYIPGAEPQFSSISGAPTNTLTDVALFWWSRDLRPDLPNNVRPIDSPPERRNEAFWQSLTPYIVGYGISASRDSAATRARIAASQAITWPGVRIENRPTEIGSVLTDRDVAPPDQIDCAYNAATNPSGCGRVDDTLRAARAARGDFLTATDVGGLAAQIAAAFNAIGELQGTGTAAAGRSSLLRAGDQVFLASFVTNRWTGELAAYDGLTWFAAQQAGSAPVPQWRANFPQPSARRLLTSTAATAAGAEFLWASLATAQRAAIGSEAMLNYVRGDQSSESPAGPLRRRFSLLGDIVNSQPRYSKATDQGYGPGRLPAAGGGASYRAYFAAQSDAVNGRRANVMVGANGGVFHAFDAATGGELFGYVPRAVHASLPLLSLPGYAHRYFVDGPTSEGDAFWNGSWRTVVVGTSGAGPKSVFAIDVSNPAATGAGDVLWDLTGDDHPDLGNIMQPGVIGSALDGNWYYFVGNGYESQNDKARLLAISLRDGTVYSIQTDGAGGPNPADSSIDNRPNGLGGVTPVYDANRNIVEIYAGDRLGRLWKFDLNSTNRSSWRVATSNGAPLFVATDSAANRQSITAAPRVSYHPLGGRYITFGTGRFFERADKADQQVQAIYALWEQDPSAPVAISRSQLRQLSLTETTLTTSTGDQVFRAINGQGNIAWSTDRGWYFDLRVGAAATGERVIVSGVDDLGYINISSYEPLANGDPCLGGGQSFFYRLDIANTFRRSGFAGRNADIVGARSPGTIAPVGTFRARTELPPNRGAGTDLRQLLGQRPATGLPDPCTKAVVPGGVVPLECQGIFMRTWRDLPRD